MADWEDAPTPITTSTVFSEWETAPIPKEEEVPLWKTAAVSALKGILPASAGWAGAAGGAALGAPFGPVGAIGGGLVGGFGAGIGASVAQEEALQAAAPEMSREASRIQEANPITSTVASMAPMAGLTGVGTKALREIGKSLGVKTSTVAAGAAGIGGAAELGSELVSGKDVNLGSVAAAAALSPFMMGGTRAGQVITSAVEKGVGKVVPPKPTVTPEITPEVPTKSSVDTTLEQWQTEVANEVPIAKPVEPPVASVTPLEVVATPEGIPTPQVDVDTRLKALEKELDYFRDPPKEYHPKDAVETINKVNKELKTETDEDVRAMLHVIKDQAKQVLEGDLHPSVVKETGLDIRRNGNYIDVVEVPENLQRQGIGTKIVENLETDMKAEGHKSAFLLAKDNKKSISFWEKQGYQIDPSHVREKGENVPMSKKFKEDTLKITDTPGKTPLARTNNKDQITLNEPAIKADFEAGFPYIFSPDSPTGLQKAEVFKQLGINKEQFSQLVRTPEEYSAFIKAHEESHVKNGDKTTYPRTEEGKVDLMHPDAIAIEVRATQDALNAIKKPELPLKEGKIPSIYDVVDEADFHAKGKQVLKEQGPEVARKFADNYIRARGTDPVLVQQNVNQFISKEIQQHGTTVEAASDIIEKGANNILANERLADIYSQSVVDRIPDAKMRDKITRALEKERESDTLNPRTDKEAISVLKEVETRLSKIGVEAKQAGLLEGLRDNYVTHILDWSKSKLSKQEQADFMQKIQEKLAAAPKDSKLVKDFTQKRQFTFLRDLEEMLATMRAQDFAGMDHGVVVHTDIAKIVNAYEKAMQTAKIQKSMIDYLKINKDVNGRPWLMKDGDAAKEAKYVSFEGKGARPLKDYRVHPDLADSMNFMFREKDPGMLVRGLGAVSHLTKALNTVGSLFHAKSLIEAGGLTSPGLMLKEIFTAGSGTRAALKALKSGDDPLIDLLIREGGLMVKVEDIQRTIVPEVGQFLDNTATKFSKLLKGPDVKLVQHITDPLDKVVLQKLNAFTWDFMHAGQKVNVAKHLFTKMKLKNPEIPDAVLAKEVGDYVNSTFGGLNWLQVANSVQNKYLQALSKKVMNTTGREWAQIVMFAPDWTVSTLRAFTNALPKELAKPKNWHLLEGAKGVYNPKTKGDLARRYVVTTALSWLTLLNGINMMMSDKPIWENKDPTRVEFKDGTSMQAAKHSMEAAHWMMAPDKTLGNKLGFWPKAIFVGTTATAYPSPTAPKLKDPSALGRAKAIALLGAPFQVSSAIQAPEGEALKRAGLSTMGFPVYGVAKDKLKESQRKGRLEAKEKRLRQMLEEAR